MGKITTEEWIKRAREIHGDKYDYSKSEYINARTNITMICHEKDEHGVKHGEFSITPNHHLQGQGCPKCKRGFSVKKTENFIEKSKLIHGDKFDYSEVKYIKNNLKVRIICHEKDKLGEEHGEFLMRPNDHLMGVGCPKCGNKRRSELKKYSLNEFIEKAKKIHGDKYDYSKVEYKGSLIEVCIICPIHGEFWQIPNAHLNGQGCPECAKSKIWDTRGRISTEEFVEKAKKVHVDKYDYSKVEYVNGKTKVCIICHEKDEDGNKHGEFWQTPHIHLSGHGCPICGNSVKSTTEKFIEKAKVIHNNKYDYSKIDYKGNKIKICIICHEKNENGVEHGEFWQVPNEHLSGKGCSKCNIGKIGNNIRLTTEEFIKRAKEIHGNKYDYSKVNYIDKKTKVCITCPVHGEFWQTPNNHLHDKAGCPICKESKLEGKIALLLDNNTIKYERQKKFPWLGALSLDFYLPDYNIAIECQGRQHFEPVTAFGGEEEFKKILERDTRKSSLCEENDVKLILYSEERFKKYNPSLYYNEEELLKAIKEKDI